MLTKNEIKSWSTLIHWCAVKSSFPFVWNRKQLKLQRSNSTLRKIVNRLMSIYGVIASLYFLYDGVIQCTPCYPRKMIINGLYFIYLAGVTALRISYDVFTIETIELVNQIFLLNPTLGGRYMGSEFARRSRLQDFGCVLVWVSNLATSIPFFCVVLFLKEEISLISLKLCTYYEAGWTTRWIVFLLTEPFIHYECICYEAFAVSCVLYIYMVLHTWLKRSWQGIFELFPFWIRCCKCFYLYSIIWPNSKDLPQDTLVQNCVQVYNVCQLLNKLGNVVYGTLSLPVLKLDLGLLITSCTVTLILFFDKLDMFSAAFISCLLIACIVFTFGTGHVVSLIAMTSCHFHGNLLSVATRIGSSLERKVQSRRVKSVPPISCNLASLYRMDATAKLTFLDSLINGIVFALLAYTN